MRSMRLDRLKPGRTARITDMRVEGSLGRRLAELGMTRGATVRLVRRAPLGDPIEYVVRGAHIAIRASDAARVETEGE